MIKSKFYISMEDDEIELIEFHAHDGTQLSRVIVHTPAEALEVLTRWFTWAATHAPIEPS